MEPRRITRSTHARSRRRLLFECDTDPKSSVDECSLCEASKKNAIASAKNPTGSCRVDFFVLLLQNVAERQCWRWESNRNADEENGESVNNPIASDIIYFTCSLRKYCIHRKMYAYFRDISSNMFLKEKRTALHRLFQIGQKYYHALQRFRYHVAYKRRIHGPTIDFVGTEIQFDQRVVVRIDNAIYYYSASEVIKIIANALTYFEPFVSHMFRTVRAPMNPYTNKPFTIECLYSIYLQCKLMRRPIATKNETVFDLFFQCNFSRKVLEMKHDAILNRISVERFIATLTVASLRMYGNWMIEYVNTDRLIPHEICIDEDLPNSIFADNLRPAIHNYIRYQYIIHATNENEARTLIYRIQKFLTNFFRIHPKFGRRIWLRGGTTYHINIT